MVGEGLGLGWAAQQGRSTAMVTEQGAACRVGWAVWPVGCRLDMPRLEFVAFSIAWENDFFFFKCNFKEVILWIVCWRGCGKVV